MSADTAPQTPAESHWDRRDSLILGALLLSFALSRILWLALNLDAASYWEENYRWSSAVEILEGPIQPIFDYQADHYQGGSLVVILMTLPTFALFGDSAFVLKLSAVAFSLLTLAALYLLGRLFFGRTVGVLVGLAYLSGPPLVAFSGLVTMGSHGESTLFSLLQLTLFFGLLSGRWRTPLGWLLFGGVSGLGIWYCYTSGLSLVACVLTWLLVARPPRPAELGWVIAGGLIGLAPWFAYNLDRDLVGLTRIYEMFGYGDPIDDWMPRAASDKLRLLITRDLHTGLLFPFRDRLPRALEAGLTAAYFVPLVGATLLAFLRSTGLAPRFMGTTVIAQEPAQQRRELPFLVYGLVFFAVFMLSDFSIDPTIDAHAYRLFLPAAVLLAFPAAITAGRALAAGTMARRIGMAGCAITLLASATGTLLLATRTPNNNQHLTIRGGDMVRGLLLHRKWEREIDRALNSALVVPDDGRRRYETLMGIGWGLEYRFEKSGTIATLMKHVKHLDMEHREPIVVGIRWALINRVGKLNQMLKWGDGTLYHYKLLARLNKLAKFLDSPTTWYALTGRRVGVPKAAPPPPN